VSSGLLRDDAKQRPPVSTQPVSVSFTRSGKQARWVPDSGSLLDPAESRGLAPAHSCPQGMCGSCAHALGAGSVTYATPPASKVAAGQMLLCHAQPAEGSGPIVIEA
jgi:uncharacterized protein